MNREFRQANWIPLRRMDQALRRIATTVSVSLLLASCGAPEPAPRAGAPVPSRFDTAQVVRGGQLAAAGNCVSCHTAPGGKQYAITE